MIQEPFASFFRRLTGSPPYQWQAHLAEQGFVDILAVPTGLGKTEGAVLAWAWRFFMGKGEPRHLVYCLPMRSLVRQTVERLRACFQRLDGVMNVKVYQLMGGAIEDEWAGQPELPWVLVGTQDQLLSRALNRGYSMSRFEWPVHFGLLNNDCRWIIDEVQLMGPGLWTTAQLDWMRRKRFTALFDCPTTWMSATVGTSFLETVDRQKDQLATGTRLPLDWIRNDPNPEIQRRCARQFKSIAKWQPGPPTKKEVKSVDESFWKTLAGAVAKEHVAGTLSLVICNTVDAARSVFEHLPDGVPKTLLTSRFRRQDREEHEQKLLDFEAKRKATEAERAAAGRNHEMGLPIRDDPGLICVSTQVVEAGVDVSAHHLWSEIAPWPAVIQRLGRLNRDGRDANAKAWFWKAPVEKGKGKKRDTVFVAPYRLEEVERGEKLIDAVIRENSGQPFAQILAALERKHAADLDAALQPEPAPMPRALDVHGLFSTERDLHGGFTDVSSFVRGTDPDADLTVVWREWEGGATRKPPAGDDLDGPPLDVAAEGCPVPFYRLRAILKTSKALAWVWNDEEDQWDSISAEALRPGMVVMLHREAGGYSEDLGWTGRTEDKLDEVPPAGRGRALADDQETSIGYWATVDVHLEDARREATRLCDALGIQGDLRTAVIEAAGLHDLGKVHPQWQSALPGTAPGLQGPWAKCPCVLRVDLASDRFRKHLGERISGLRPGALFLAEGKCWFKGKEALRLCWALDRRLGHEELDQLRREQGVLRVGHLGFRPNMRHEAASALAMWHRYRAGEAGYPALAVYLAAAHHGKVRTLLRSLTDNGDDAFGVRPQASALAWNGRLWPMDFSVVKDGAEGEWTSRGFLLKGHGWTGLISDLLGPWHPDDSSSAAVVPEHEPKRLGPFQLAYLEALVRIADWRASNSPSRCTKPSEVAHGG